MVCQACQVIKGNERPCRNYARKNLTCCYQHRKLENVKYILSIYEEFIDEMNFALDNAVEWELQECRLNILSFLTR